MSALRHSLMRNRRGAHDDIKHPRVQSRLNWCFQLSQGCILPISRSASTEPASKSATRSGRTDECRQAPIKRALLERAQDSTWPAHSFAQATSPHKHCMNKPGIPPSKDCYIRVYLGIWTSVQSKANVEAVLVSLWQ